MSLRAIVFANLEAAMVDNDYAEELLKWAPLQIAYDMCAYAEDAQDQLAEDLVPHIIDWLVENGHPIND